MSAAQPGDTPPIEVRIAEPTADNAARLWRCYQQAFWDDRELLERTCDPANAAGGIDGLTEPLTCDDILHAMQGQDTVTLEAPGRGGQSAGFIIVRYAGRDARAIASFAEYFLHEVFRREALQFVSAKAQREFADVLARGELLYFAEFVSAGGRSTSAALLLATYREVCLGRLASRSCTFVGKCLDAVRIGRCTNAQGNRPVKALAEFLGLQKVARCDQIRALQVAADQPHLERAFDARPAQVEAVLTFALYLGSAARAAERVAARPPE